MNKSTRQQALMAAMKATLSFGVVACGVATTPGPEPVDDTAAYRNVSSDSGKNHRGAVEDCGSNTVACSVREADGGPVETTPGCCLAKLAPVVADASPWNAPVPDTDEAFACCRAAIAGYYSWFDSPDPSDGGIARWDAPETRVFQACCSKFSRWGVPRSQENHILTENEQVTCTPWGPPTPPKMPKRIVNRAARKALNETGIA